MTVAGTVAFADIWHVRIEPTSWQYVSRAEYDVAADSLGSAIAQALAFFNRDKEGQFRASPEHVTAVVRTELEWPLLVVSTVETMNYDRSEHTAQITEPYEPEAPTWTPPAPPSPDAPQPHKASVPLLSSRGLAKRDGGKSGYETA